MMRRTAGHKERGPLIEFLKVPDRVYLGAFDYTPEDTDKVVYFTIDDKLPYNNFFHDFGPLHIGHMYRFAVFLHEILGEDENEGKAVVFYSENNPKARANAACVLCCYMVLIQGWPPHLVLAPIAQADPPFMPFRDAGYAVADFLLTIQDVVYGVWKAKEKKLFDMKSFNLEEYENYERVDQGDLNELPPYFVAFASPEQPGYDPKNDTSTATYPVEAPFTSVLDFFNSHDVKLVVRLNSKLYDSREFEKRGIKHIDLIFEDGTCPSMLYVQAFLGAVECVIKHGGKVAVHCKAGLGRTGCLIGAHLIYSYGFTAAEVIAYMRFMRPGMVVGPQQHWLYLHQNEFRDWRRTMTLSKIPDQSLAGYCPLVPVNSPEALGGSGGRNSGSNANGAASPPRTPERSILSSVDNTASALPAPTPGQPRKNSPSPNRERPAAGSETASNRRVRSKNYGHGSRYTTNSDDEEIPHEFEDENHHSDEVENIPMASVTTVSNINNTQQHSPVRHVGMASYDQMTVGRKLRSASNPTGTLRGRQQRNVTPNRVQMTTTTTTTTTKYVVNAQDVRRSTRLYSGGVRKVSGRANK